MKPRPRPKSDYTICSEVSNSVIMERIIKEGAEYHAYECLSYVWTGLQRRGFNRRCEDCKYYLKEE